MIKNMLFSHIFQPRLNMSFYKHFKCLFTNLKSRNPSNDKNNSFNSQNYFENKKIANISRKEIKNMIEEKDNIIRKPIKSSGPGGQHVNKTQSAILLQDKTTNISVKVGNSRDSVVNNGIAKKRLVDKLDLHYNGTDSKIAKKIEKIKKQKDRNRRKSENKYNPVKDNHDSKQ